MDANGGELLSILMPVYNERRTLANIVGRIQNTKFQIPIEIVCVDDGSADGSRQILKDLSDKDDRIKVILHEKNQGKGAAIRTAIQNMSGTIAIVQDADLEYNPKEIPKLIQPILDGYADAVYGTRFGGNECRRVLYYWHAVGNRIVTFLTNIVCDLTLTDMETCYKAVRGDVLKQTILKANDFGLEPELTVRLAQWGLRIYEMPISYSGRTYDEGKKITWRDGVKALWVIIKTAWIDQKFTTNEDFFVFRTMQGSRKELDWFYKKIASYVGDSVLLLGNGGGAYAPMMLNREEILCADVDPYCIELINRKFGHLNNFHTKLVDLTSRDLLNKHDLSSNGRLFETVVIVNALEHVDDENQILENVKHSLKDGGRAIFIVPHHPGLYTRYDQALGHRRRYLPKQLRETLESQGFRVVAMKQHNRMGFIGWFINGVVLGKKTISSKQVRLYQALLPFAKVVEVVPGLPGMTLIAVAEKGAPTGKAAE